MCAGMCVCADPRPTNLSDEQVPPVLLVPLHHCGSPIILFALATLAPASLEFGKGCGLLLQTQSCRAFPQLLTLPPGVVPLGLPPAELGLNRRLGLLPELRQPLGALHHRLQVLL